MSARSVLVTGAGGFVGRHLAAALTRAGWSVVGCDRAGERPESVAAWHALDLTDTRALAALVREASPAAVVHLAAIAAPPAAARDPLAALRVNYGAVDALIAALDSHAPRARLLFVSSGEVYGFAPADAPPFRESATPAPATLYSATKLAAEWLVARAAERGLDAVRVRPFNHTGPGRPDAYAESSFARQLVEIERGRAEPVLRVGNLAALRDFSDVRDVVEAYALLLEHAPGGSLFNVCSGRARSIGSVLEELAALSKAAPRVEVDPARYRPAEPARLASCGDPGALRALGWSPRYAFRDTLGALLDDWRARG